MSGGRFDYNQFQLVRIAEDIEHELERQGTKKPKEELWGSSDYYKENPNETVFYTYPQDIQEEFKKAVQLLRQAYVYAQRIDWLLSGDDGEDSFRERLKEDLDKLNQTT
jgi:hypothetical protein